MSACNLTQHEITVEEVHRNLPPSALYEHAILYEKDAHIAENGALVAYSGSKTGRSPKDKRVVKQTLRRTMSGGGRSISRSIRTHLR
jgi:phosphoenolpyruvate carboxykinase (ATP)